MRTEIQVLRPIEEVLSNAGFTVKKDGPFVHVLGKPEMLVKAVERLPVDPLADPLTLESDPNMALAMFEVGVDDEGKTKGLGNMSIVDERAFNAAVTA
jgi:hypothetical protein